MDTLPLLAKASMRSKKGKSHYGSLHLNPDSPKHGGQQAHEKGVPQSPRGQGIEAEELQKTPMSPGSSRRTLHSLWRKTERQEPYSPPSTRERALLESIEESTSRLLDLNARRKNLLQTGGSADQWGDLFEEAEDARAEHEVAVNELYDAMGMVKAFKEHGIKHWLEWPLAGAGDQGEPAKVSAASPRPLLNAELLQMLKGSSNADIEGAKASAADSILECKERLNVIKQEGQHIDDKIRTLNGRRRELLDEKNKLTQDRNLQASFVACADDELRRRHSSLEKASGSVPSTPRGQQNSHQ